ncbi:MAG: tetratricopeptide repeat protein [Capsulimonadaceae bacterium]
MAQRKRIRQSEAGGDTTRRDSPEPARGKPSPAAQDIASGAAGASSARHHHGRASRRSHTADTTGVEIVESTAPDSTVVRARFIASALALVTILVYWVAVHNGFLAVDDDKAVYANPHLADPLYFWTKPYFRLYTPVTYDIYSLVGSIARMGRPLPTPIGGTTDLSPSMFHAANVVFHAANVALVFWLLRVLLTRPGLLPEGPEWRIDAGAAAGALVFGLDPLQAEVVSWVNGANNIFSGLFCLLALWLYVRSAMAHPTRTDPGVRTRWFLAATASFVLALLAKPTAVALPIVAWAVDGLLLRRKRRESMPLLVWLVIALAFVPVTIYASTETQKIVQTPLWLRPFVAGDAYTFYLWKLLWPVHLGFDYGRNPTFVLRHTPWFLTWLIPAAIAAVLWARRRVWPVPAGAGAIFAASLVPTVGLVSSYFNIVTVSADRYVYLAMLGPALAVAWLLARRSHPAVFGIAAVLIALCGAAAHRQVTYWRTTYSIMSHSVAVSPDGWFAQSNLATYLDRIGDPVRALPHAEAVVRLDPDYPVGRANLGVVLGELGRRDEAVVEFEKAASLDPPVQQGDRVGVTDSYMNDCLDAGIQLKALGRFDEAEAEFQDAAKFGYPPAVAALADLRNASTNSAAAATGAAINTRAHQRWNSGDHAGALDLFAKAVDADPNSPVLHSDYAVALSQSGRNVDAVAQLRAAIAVDSGNAGTHLDLGQLLIGLRDKSGALTEIRTALKISPGDPTATMLLQKAMAMP